MTPPIIAIVGYSDAGKTTVATALIRIFASHGYRIAAVKHCHHGHQLDLPTKDSAKLFSAGAARMVLGSPGQVTSIHRVEGDLPLEQIVASLDGSYDLVVAEGFKNSSAPKVLVLASEPRLPWPPGVLAVMATDPIEASVPVYTFAEVERLAEQIRREVLGSPTLVPEVSLMVDGESVPLSSFPSSALREVVLGFLKALKDVPESPQTVRIMIGPKQATA